MSDQNTVPPNWEGIATLLVLQDQVKNLKNLREFGYFTTNETHRMIHFNTSFLWQYYDVVEVRLLSQSEVPEVDSQSAVSLWVKKCIKEITKLPNSKKVQTLDFENIATNPELKTYIEQDIFSKEVMNLWPSALPKYVLWSPFLDEHEDITGGLIFFRSHAFTEQELKMFTWLSRNYQYTWQFLTKHKMLFLKRLFKRKKNIIIASIAALIILLFPVRLSVVADATVSPKDPALINAPIAGTIKSFSVKPGDTVSKDQLLLQLDKKDILNTIQIDERKVSYSQAKLRSANEQGYEKPETRSEIPILEAELNVNQAELDYYKAILNKTDITSPIDGVAIFESKEDWIGQPVQEGENIMMIANPDNVQLKIELPVANLINLNVGDKGKFYVYGQLSETPVQLTQIGYNAKMTASKILAYQYIADFTDPSSKPLLGSQGTVRLYGHYVPLIYYVLRRPLHAVREFFGV